MGGKQVLNSHIFEMLRQARTYDFPIAITNQVRAKQTLNQHIFDMLRQARVFDFPIAIANQVRAIPNALPMYGPLSTMQAVGERGRVICQEI
jgi:RecA/RadA recombinase